jgi:peptidoglycan-associated lipoprotein
MNMKPWIVSVSLAAALVGTTGCATKKYVKTETGAVNTRVDEVQGQVEETQTRLNTHDKTLAAHEQKMGEISQTAQDALQRAQEAGKLAEGKFLYETVLTDEKVKFGFDTSDLSPEAQSALDDFAAKIKQDNKNVYVEIQGHTDNIGSDKYNQELGLLRAEAVRRYLNQKQSFPLHRINVISYGKTTPIADNKSRDGRAQNRRVVLVVLD